MKFRTYFNACINQHFILQVWMLLLVFILSTFGPSRERVKVSVVVPVHNVEGFIEECLKSILNQSLSDIEVICVEDCSTDKTLNVIEKMARYDSRIKIIRHQKNLGPGISRNEALSKAVGEYVCFIDSDDWIMPGFLEKLYNSAKKFDTDFSFCQITNFNHEKKEFYVRKEFGFSLSDAFSNKKFTWRDIIKSIFVINLNPVNKLYRTKFLLENNIKFTETFFLEDHTFSFCVIILSKSISYVPERLYVYRTGHKRSLSYSNDEKLMVCFQEYKKMERAALAFGMDTVTVQVFNYIAQSAALRNLGVEKWWKKYYVRIAKKFFRNSEILKAYDYNQFSNIARSFLHQLFLHMKDDGVKPDQLHYNFHHLNPSAEQYFQGAHKHNQMYSTY